MNSTPFLEVKAIDCFYGNLKVLTQASLKLDQGETAALFGPNGHGKSTLLKTISGIHPPRSGSIRYRGQEIAGWPPEKIVEMGLVYIPEDRNLFADMTVYENLVLGAYNSRARKKLSASLEVVFALFPRLSERRDQMATTLSGGESRMLAVGRGLMSCASLLLIDEPSIGLSPLFRKIVFEAIDNIRKRTDTTILIVEQEVDHALRLADNVFLLKKGRVILGKKASEIDKTQIMKAYF